MATKKTATKKQAAASTNAVAKKTTPSVTKKAPAKVAAKRPVKEVPKPPEIQKKASKFTAEQVERRLWMAVATRWSPKSKVADLTSAVTNSAAALKASGAFDTKHVDDAAAFLTDWSSKL